LLLVLASEIPDTLLQEAAVGVNEVADEGVELDYVWANVQKIATGDTAGMLMSGVWGITEETSRGDSEMFPMFDVGEGLDIGRDESHVYVPDVFRGYGEDGLNGFAIAVVGWSQP
jgi:hypothetical protein